MLTKERAREILVRRGNRWLNSPERFRDYFDAAFALLVKKGWCQGAYARSRRGYALHSGKDRNAASFCGQGALERVTPEHKEFVVCQSLLSAALGCTPRGKWSIPAVNDNPTVKMEVAKAEIFAGYRNVLNVLGEMV